MNPDDTIVAVSSPSGSSPRGVVRLSGPEAARIAERLFLASRGERLSAVNENRRLEGRLNIEGADLPASVYVFKAPRSYTRQDIVELHLLGAPGVLGLLFEECLDAGARPAEAGEFTARAFLAGRFDLSQVHGIAGMIAARSDQQLRAAERLLHGDLARTADQAREELADLLSLVEGALDFADEPIEFITPAELCRRLADVRDALGRTAAAGLRGERWDQLPRILLAGPPNAGKSSLLNRLTGFDRAICTPVAGTTRDVLSAPMQIGSSEYLLMDSAGLAAGGKRGPALSPGRSARPRTASREVPVPFCHPAEDELHDQAQSAARQAVKDADLVLYVLDITSPDLADAAAEARQTAGAVPCVLVANKCDLISEDRWATVSAELAGRSGWAVRVVSATTGAGEDALKEAIEAALADRGTSSHDAGIALMAEHRDALDRAMRAIDAAVELAERGGERLEEAELVAAELRAAAQALGTLVGEEDVEDLLGRIFSRFCIGK